MIRLSCILMLSATVLTGTLPISLHADEASTAEPFRVPVDEESGITTVTVPAENGEVAWSDVIRALARSGRLDDAVLQKLPEGHIDLNDPRGRFGLIGLNLVLPPEISISVRRDDAGAEPSLEITIDEPGLERRTRDIQRCLRERAAADAGNAEKYGMTLDEDWRQFEPSRPVVLLIHGYNSSATSLSELHAAVREAGHAVAVFVYPNDGPIEESADLLAAELRAFADAHPGRDVSIVAHSMGGLVARAVIENPELDPGNVRRLIMVATPNQGSQLACFPGGLDAGDHLTSRPDDGLPGLFRDAAADGLNESCHDMRPGSDFLKELNSRERNPEVRYSLLIGTGGPLSPESLDELRRILDAAAADNPLARLLRPRLREPLDDLDEVLVDEGDGAVAVKRARLEGVEDTELLEFSHLTITRAFDTPTGESLLNAILTRLE